jgi:LmbE family N-acetylglucosaminyl deacetylase
MKIPRLAYSLSLILFLFLSVALHAQEKQKGPNVLVVVAHPDDETAFAATIYKITHELNGMVDQCVITNGEGGYKYSTLAESYYGLDLTDEAVGRANLPRIRKQELMNAGKIIGTHNIFFLDQKDAHYGLDEHEPLDTSWNVPWVSTRLHEILVNTHYDFVFCLLPTAETHGGHKAATLLALRAVQSMPANMRPVILGGSVSSLPDSAGKDKTPPLIFNQLRDYSETKVEGQSSMYSFDRSVTFGYRNKLSYKIIVNWEIAEHKSQGTMQLAMNMGDLENYWFFAINSPEAKRKCAELFNELKKLPFKIREY